MKNLKKAVVTGASGYIGSRLTKALVDEGWQVAIIVRESSQLTILEDYAQRVEILRYDGNPASMMQFFQKIGPVDVVFHLASCFISDHKWNQIEQLLMSNILFGTILLEAMTVNGCDKFVNVSTAWQHYQQETYNPVNLYAATKEAFEKIITYYVEAKALNCITLELFDTYGEGDSRRKIINLLKVCWKTEEPLEMTGGEQEMDLVYIDDVIRAFLITADILNGQTGQKKYSVATQNPYLLKQIVGLIEAEVGQPLNVTFGKRSYHPREMMKVWRYGELLPGWKVTTELEDGLKKIFR